MPMKTELMETELISRVRFIFQSHFGAAPTLIGQAPARVNLIGEHTDYNDGFVFPCAIDFQTIVCASPRADNDICVIAADFNEEKDQFLIGATIPHSEAYSWSNYVRGVVQYLHNRVPFGGLNLCIGGNIPKGAGLSSSASLEVAIVTAINYLYDLRLTGREIALLCQEAENKYVGCNCGIMDQLISVKGEKGHALLIDCRSLETKSVDIPEEMVVLIIHSHVERGLVDSEYNTRRQQCETVAQFFGVPALRDISLKQLLATTELDALLMKRARHVVSENERTLQLARALRQNDYEMISLLMAQSHASMRDDFEITHPAIDYLVDIIADVLGSSGGVRMTGGGFGGCVVALVPEKLAEKVCHVVEEKYQAHTSLPASIYQCRPQNGAGLVSNV